MVDITKWSSSGTATEPDQSSINAGFECGAADPKTFNWIIQELAKLANAGLVFAKDLELRVKANEDGLTSVNQAVTSVTNGFNDFIKSWVDVSTLQNNDIIKWDATAKRFVRSVLSTASAGLSSVASGTSLSGNGTASSKLEVNIKNDGSLAGIGTDSNKLKLNIKSDSSLVGAGNSASQLKINIQKDSSLVGAGTSASPLKLNARTGNTINGVGTSASPLQINATETAKDVATKFNVTFGNGTATPANQTNNGAPIVLPFTSDFGKVFSGGAWNTVSGGGGLNLNFASPDATNGTCAVLPDGMYLLSWDEGFGNIFYTIAFINSSLTFCVRYGVAGGVNGWGLKVDTTTSIRAGGLAASTATFTRAWKIG